MFDLKRPCKDCPFRRSRAGAYRLKPERLEEIRTATAFQCHKTADYSAGDDEGRSGDKPQQCAGLMAVLHAQKTPNQIMQVAQRLISYDPGRIETLDTFPTWEDVQKAHGRQEDPPNEISV